MAAEDSPAARFSSSVLPAKPGLEGSLSLPLGFILNPLAGGAGISIPRISSDEMNICLTCGSYLNMYSPLDSNYQTWTCSICQARNAFPNSLSSSQALSSAIVEYVQVTAGTQLPTSKPHCHPDEDDLSTHSDEKVDDPTMIAIDANIPPEEVNALLKYLSLLNLNNVGLMIFSSNIHVYQIGLKGIASADIYSPTLDPADCGIEADERMYWGSFEEVEYCANVYFGTSGMQAHDPDMVTSVNTSEQKPPPPSRAEMLRLKREARMKKNRSEDNFDGFDPHGAAELIKMLREGNTHKSQRQGLRCTGEAVQYAKHLLCGTKSKTRRILMFTNGCCNVGKGSVVAEEYDSRNGQFSRGDVLDPDEALLASKFMYSLGEDAFSNGIGIDVFCGGSTSLGISSFLSLVKASGGYVLSHSSFEDVACFNDVSFVCKKTHMSRATAANRDADIVGLRMTGAHAMNSLNGVIVDVRMPR